MSKFEMLDLLLQENRGFIKVAEAMELGVSIAYLGEYVRSRGLERATNGLSFLREVVVAVLESQSFSKIWSSAVGQWQYSRRNPVYHVDILSSFLIQYFQYKDSNRSNHSF